jgi:hypothetical protein
MNEFACCHTNFDLLVNVFINLFITSLRQTNSGCGVNGLFVGCIMYADDLVVLSASVDGLQRMLDCCYNVSRDLELESNCAKSRCMITGPVFKRHISDMHLGTQTIPWCNSFRYLGITFLTGNKLLVDVGAIKRTFFRALNCIWGNASTLEEVVELCLHESYCLSIKELSVVNAVL